MGAIDPFYRQERMRELGIHWQPLRGDWNPGPTLEDVSLTAGDGDYEDPWADLNEMQKEIMFALPSTARELTVHLDASFHSVRSRLRRLIVKGYVVREERPLPEPHVYHSKEEFDAKA
jgi:hypothetical protein